MSTPYELEELSLLKLYPHARFASVTKTGSALASDFITATTGARIRILNLQFVATGLPTAGSIFLATLIEDPLTEFLYVYLNTNRERVVELTWEDRPIVLPVSTKVRYAVSVPAGQSWSLRALYDVFKDPS